MITAIKRIGLAIALVTVFTVSIGFANASNTVHQHKNVDGNCQDVIYPSETHSDIPFLYYPVSYTHLTLPTILLV